MRKFLFWASSFTFLGFVLFSYLVSQELFTQFDFDTTVRIQDKIPPSFDLIFSIISLAGIFEVTTIVWLVITFTVLFRRWWKAFFAMMLFPISQVIELFGKFFLFHPSPPFMFYRGVLPFDFPSTHVQVEYSYPSGHTIRMSFLIVFAFFLVTYKTSGIIRTFLQASLVVLLFAIFISRVSLGEHWTTDVIGGTMLGISFGIIAGIAIPARLNESHNHSLDKSSS